MDKSPHIVICKIGEPQYIFASAPIKIYDQLSNTFLPVSNAQGLGYSVQAKMRSTDVNGPVLGDYILSWPTVDLWRLKLSTNTANFKPCDAAVDLKVIAPNGDVMYSKTHVYKIVLAATR